MNADSRRWSLLGTVLLSAWLVTACNTVEGVGEDIEEAGEEIEDAAD